MVITILEAAVEPANQGKLQESFEDKTREVPASIVQSYLAQDQADPMIWKIITLWRSAEDLAAMRSSGETPTGVLIFNQAGAQPQLTVLSIKKSARQ